MKRGKSKEDKKKACRRSLLPGKLLLYSIRGDLIGELLPGEKVDFQLLQRRPMKVKDLKKG